MPLFTTDSSGKLLTVRVERDAAIFPAFTSRPLTVFDRDWSGILVNAHQGSIKTGPVDPAPYANGTIALDVSSSGSAAGVLAEATSDGVWDGKAVFQGVRTYEPSLSTWTTPDAYDGDVHDPMTQKRYMWNRNNPYAYSDPSGYCAEGRNGCMGGIDWPALDRFANGMFQIMSLLLPSGGAGTAGEAAIAARGMFALGSESSVKALAVHVVERHMIGGSMSAGRSAFSHGTSLGEIAKMVKTTVSKGSVRVEGTSNVYTLDIGKVIGNDASGNPTRFLRVVTDGKNNLLTTYPIPK